MKSEINITAIEFKEGVFNNKPFLTCTVCYIDSYGGHRIKCLDKEFVESLCKDYAVAHAECVKPDSKYETYYFDYLPIEADFIKDRYHEGKSILRSIRAI